MYVFPHGVIEPHNVLRGLGILGRQSDHHVFILVLINKEKVSDKTKKKAVFFVTGITIMLNIVFQPTSASI